MSRMEKKKNIQKKKKYRKLLVLFVVMFLISGVYITDYTLREVLAIEDTRVAGYEKDSNNYVIYLLGEKIHVKKEVVEEKINTIQSIINKEYNRLKGWIIDQWNRNVG